MRKVDLFRKGTNQIRFFWDIAKAVHFKGKTGSASDKKILIRVSPQK